MRASASLLIFATALSSFSGVSGSVIPHPPPTESDLVNVDEPPHFRVGVPVPPPVNTPSPKPMVKTGAQGKDQIRRLNNRRHTTNDPNRDMNDPNRDMGLSRDPADGKDKLPDRPGKHAGPETSWPVNFHPEEVRN